MSDQVLNISFKVDSSNVASDATKAGEEAGEAFKKGFASVDLSPTMKANVAAAAAFGEQARQIGAQLAALKQPDGTIAIDGALAAAVAKAAGQATAPRAAAPAEPPAPPKKHPETRPEPEHEASEGKAELAKTGLTAARAVFEGIASFGASGSLRGLRTAVGEVGVEAGEAAGKFGLLSKSALGVGGIVAATAAAVGEVGKDMSEDFKEQTLGVDDLANRSGLGKGPILGLRELFEKHGFNADEFSRGLARANLVQQHQRAALAKTAASEPLDAADAQDHLAESLRKTVDATDTLAKSESDITQARAKAATVYADAKTKDKIARRDAVAILRPASRPRRFRCARTSPARYCVFD